MNVNINSIYHPYDGVLNSTKMLLRKYIDDCDSIADQISKVEIEIGRAYTQATDTTTSTSLNGTCEQFFRVEIHHQSGKVTNQEFKDLNDAMQSYSYQLAHYGKRKLRVWAVQPSGQNLIVSHR